ncbi:MAG: HAD hydrolase-like protein [Lachnospiraceae bacterium]|nr:HAD hydrolase-like protein [Lachnospiraceae bacterium]
MKKYDLIVFDLDGTLMKTEDGVLGSAVKAIEELGYEAPPWERMLNWIGPPIQKSFQEEFGLTAGAAQEMTRVFRKYYASEGCLIAEPYEGIFDVLRALRAAGAKTAVGTNKREDYAKKMLEHFGLAPLFDVIHGPDDAGVLKKPDLIVMCAEECGVPLQRTLMVGDSVSDSNGARTAGVDFLGLTYGYGFKSREEALAAGAAVCAESTGELRELLLSM